MTIRMLTMAIGARSPESHQPVIVKHWTSHDVEARYARRPGPQAAHPVYESPIINSFHRAASL